MLSAVSRSLCSTPTFPPCSGAHLNRGVISSAVLRPKRAFYRAQGLVTSCPRPWNHPQSCLTHSRPRRRANLRTTAAKLGEGCPDPLPPRGESQTAPLDLIGGPHCR